MLYFSLYREDNCRLRDRKNTEQNIKPTHSPLSAVLLLVTAENHQYQGWIRPRFVCLISFLHTQQYLVSEYNEHFNCQICSKLDLNYREKLAGRPTINKCKHKKWLHNHCNSQLRNCSDNPWKYETKSFFKPRASYFLYLTI